MRDAPRPITPPRLPEHARPVLLPEALRPDAGVSRRVIQALRRAQWSGDLRYVKVDAGAYTFLGDLTLEDGAVTPLVLKQIPPRPGLIGLLRSFLPESRALKQIRGAVLLKQASVITSEPLLLARAKEADGFVYWLALARVPGEDCVHALARPGRDVGEEHALARALGRLVRRIDAAGLFNRDHKLSNIIMTPDAELGVVDTVGVRRSAPDPRSRERMLRAMLFEAAGTSLLPRRAVLMRCVCEAMGAADAHTAWRRLAAELRKAGDTTPRVSPLHAS